MRCRKKINLAPSLYLAAGAIHGCVLCEEDRPLIYMEDVGRHNAIDKIAGYMHLNKIGPEGKIFYTTGRLTSEMVIKCVQMRIPILVSRSGFTAWGVELAQKADLTLIGRAKGKRFIALAGDAPPGLRQRSRRVSPMSRAAPARKASVAEDDSERKSLDEDRAACCSPGGQSQRMGGGDKMSAAARRASRSSPMSSSAPSRRSIALVLNANGDPARFAAFRLAGRSPTASPALPGRLRACSPGSIGRPRNLPDAELVASFATDAPFFPRDLVRRLAVALRGGRLRSRLRAIERPGPSGLRALAGGAARRSARGAWPAACARSINGPRAIRLVEVEFPAAAGRSVLQRQPAGGSRRGRAAGRARRIRQTEGM